MCNNLKLILFSFVNLVLITTSCNESSNFNIRNSPDLSQQNHFDATHPAIADLGNPTGRFLDPCNNGGDCDSGYCLEGPDRFFVCSQTCDSASPETCPNPFRCRFVINSEADGVFICSLEQRERDTAIPIDAEDSMVKDVGVVTNLAFISDVGLEDIWINDVSVQSDAIIIQDSNYIVDSSVQSDFELEDMLFDGSDLQIIAVLDRDNDSIPDTEDNCPDIANSYQEDFDGDQMGNICDPRPNIPDYILVESRIVGILGHASGNTFNLKAHGGHQSPDRTMIGQIYMLNLNPLHERIP